MEKGKQASFQEEKVREDTKKLSPKENIDAQRGTEGTTLLRVGYRVKQTKKMVVQQHILFSHFTGILRVVKCRCLRAWWGLCSDTIASDILSKTIEYVARRYCLFAQRRMRAKNATFVGKVASESWEPKDVAVEVMEDARANGDDNKLHLHFEFPRDVFTGAKRAKKI